MKKPARFALAASAFVLASTGAVLYAKDRGNEEPVPPMPAAVSAAQNPAPPASASKAAETAATGTFQQIVFREQSSEEAAKTYPFIAEAIKSSQEPLIGADFDHPSSFPARIQLAEIHLADKNLDFVALRMMDGDYCQDGLCDMAVYVRRGDGWQQMFSLKSSIESYYATDSASTSFMVCGRDGTYQKWTMADGALEREIPVDAPGYFVPHGEARDARITASCPVPPKPPSP